jgi:peptide/nickel transport system permease protein
MITFVRHHPLLVLGLLALVLPLLAGLGADPVEQSLRQSLLPPSPDHWLGTDQLGRDLLARVAHAFLLDLGLSAGIVLLSLTLGTAAGLLAGEFGGPLDGILTFLMDMTVTLPHLVVALVLVAYLGGGSGVLVLALGLSGWVKYARIVRTETSRLKEVDFIIAARVLGAPRIRVLLRHMLPNVLPPLGGLIALQFGHAILGISALGFLGVGVQPPTPEWGTMIAEARPYIARAPWLALAPGVFLFGLTSLFLASANVIRSRSTKEGPAVGSLTLG